MSLQCDAMRCNDDRQLLGIPQGAGGARPAVGRMMAPATAKALPALPTRSVPILLTTMLRLAFVAFRRLTRGDPRGGSCASGSALAEEAVLVEPRRTPYAVNAFTSVVPLSSSIAPLRGTPSTSQLRRNVSTATRWRIGAAALRPLRVSASPMRSCSASAADGTCAAAAGRGRAGFRCSRVSICSKLCVGWCVPP